MRVETFLAKGLAMSEEGVSQEEKKSGQQASATPQRMRFKFNAEAIISPRFHVWNGRLARLRAFALEPDAIKQNFPAEHKHTDNKSDDSEERITCAPDQQSG